MGLLCSKGSPSSTNNNVDAEVFTAPVPGEDHIKHESPAKVEIPQVNKSPAEVEIEERQPESSLLPEDAPPIPDERQVLLLSGQQRWILDVESWNFDKAGWDLLYSLLPEEEAKSVRRFIRDHDRRLAMGSRLLQRSLISKTLGVPYNSVSIGRTAQNKPYFAGMRRLIESRPELSALANWNYNVSHQGSAVVIASESSCLCGVDVVDLDDVGPISQKGGLESYLTCFSDIFAPEEWDTIRAPGADAIAVLHEFYAHWAMKEAFIKAVGSGLGYDLKSVRFAKTEAQEPANSASIVASIHSKLDPKVAVYCKGILHTGWTINLQHRDRYLLCVARGPVADCLPAAAKCLQRLEVPPEEHLEALALPQKPWVTITLADIVPVGIAEALGVGKVPGDDT